MKVCSHLEVNLHYSKYNGKKCISITMHCKTYLLGDMCTVTSVFVDAFCCCFVSHTAVYIMYTSMCAYTAMSNHRMFLFFLFLFFSIAPGDIVIDICSGD